MSNPSTQLHGLLLKWVRDPLHRQCRLQLNEPANQHIHGSLDHDSYERLGIRVWSALRSHLCTPLSRQLRLEALKDE